MIDLENYVEAQHEYGHQVIHIEYRNDIIFIWDNSFKSNTYIGGTNDITLYLI